MVRLQALRARAHLRDHPEIRRIIAEIWDIIDFEKEDSPSGGREQVIGRDSYLLLNLKLARCLDVNFNEQASRFDAEKDWEWDRKGSDHLEFTTFFVSLFELADVWTPSLEIVDYVLFLEQILEAMSYQPHLHEGRRDTRRYFKQDREIQTVLSLLAPLSFVEPLQQECSDGGEMPTGAPGALLREPSPAPSGLSGLGSRLSSRASRGLDHPASRGGEGSWTPEETWRGEGGLDPPRPPPPPGGGFGFEVISIGATPLLPPGAPGYKPAAWEEEPPLDDESPPGARGGERVVASRGNRTAAVQRMSFLGNKTPDCSHTGRGGNQLGAGGEEREDDLEAATVKVPVKVPVRWTVDDVFLLADRIHRNNRLTLGEIISHLYGTEYDGFARYLKREMVRLDRSHDGVFDKEEVRRALREYTTNHLPKELYRNQTSLEDREARETVQHGDRIEIAYKNVVVYTTQARLDSFRKGKCDWHHAVLKPSPVWSLGWGSKPGEAISKEEVLQVCGNKHIANAMSKVLHEGRVVTGETGGDRHTKTIRPKAKGRQPKKPEPGRPYDEFKPNLTYDHHCHPGRRIEARVAALRGTAARQH